MTRSPPLLLFAAATASLLAAPAAAQSSSDVRSMSVTGNTPQVCSLDLGSVETGNLVNIVGLDGDTLRIQQLADSQTLASRAASATMRFAAVCNFPHKVTLESENNGLWPTDGRISDTPEGFAYAVPYAASLEWGTADGALDADAKSRRVNDSLLQVGQPTAGDMELHVEIAEGASNVEVNAPLLAGVYTDTLRIILEPR